MWDVPCVSREPCPFEMTFLFPIVWQHRVRLRKSRSGIHVLEELFLGVFESLRAEKKRKLEAEQDR